MRWGSIAGRSSAVSGSRSSSRSRLRATLAKDLVENDPHARRQIERSDAVWKDRDPDQSIFVLLADRDRKADAFAPEDQRASIWILDVPERALAFGADEQRLAELRHLGLER